MSIPQASQRAQSAPPSSNGNGHGKPPVLDDPGLRPDLPPQDLEAERYLLSGLMQDESKIPAVLAIVDVEDFYRNAHQVLFRVIRDLHQDVRAVDIITVPDELKRRGQYESIGGWEFLHEIANAAPHAENCVYHAEIIKDKAIAREVIQSATDTVRFGYAGAYTGRGLVERAAKDLALISAGPLGNGAAHPAGSLVIRADRVEEKDITWLCQDIIPCGFLTIFYGRTSVGKTFVALDFVARYTSGRAWFDSGEKLTPGNVVIFSEDPQATMLRPRLRTLGADLTKIHFVTWNAMKAYDITNTKMLDEIIKETGCRPGMVLLDPPQNFLGKVDENSNAQVRNALMHLVEWVDTRENPTAVLMITQVNKGGRDLDALERAIGSIAWVSTHRIAHCFAPDPKVKSGGFFSCAKSNLGPIPPTRKYVIVPEGKQAKVVWGDQSDQTADQVMAAPGKQTADDKVAEWLTERFREKAKWLSDDLKAQARKDGISFNRLFKAPEDSKVRNLPIRKRQEWDDANYESRWVWEAIPPWPAP